MTGAQLVGALVGLLVTLALTVAMVMALVWMARNKYRHYEKLDPDFIGAPITDAIVVDHKYLWLKVNLKRKYRITYRVHTPDGGEFVGTEVTWLAWHVKHKYFRRDAHHLVAYRPGVSEVRSLPPSQNPGWHHRARKAESAPARRPGVAAQTSPSERAISIS